MGKPNPHRLTVRARPCRSVSVRVSAGRCGLGARHAERHPAPPHGWIRRSHPRPGVAPDALDMRDPRRILREEDSGYARRQRSATDLGSAGRSGHPKQRSVCLARTLPVPGNRGLHALRRPSHFHAEYGEYRITVEVRSGIVEGRFPRRALNAVLEWHELHLDELLADWALAEQHQPLVKIPPLE
jgi:hypothetical protein